MFKRGKKQPFIDFLHVLQKKCTVEFTVNSANNFTNNAWFPLALTIEDYPKSTIAINGRIYTPSTPITQIPLQVNQLETLYTNTSMSAITNA